MSAKPPKNVTEKVTNKGFIPRKPLIFLTRDDRLLLINCTAEITAEMIDIMTAEITVKTIFEKTLNRSSRCFRSSLTQNQAKVKPKSTQIQ